ncbi:MAG TPA: amino acid adenylation domain-containing protein, partial [Longimicrobium sp.]|nr:amino acid adenylation domain-containing protein [Longimicrobium sp.]
MTLLAGWAAVLGRLAGQDDVVIGTPTANRDRREVESLIGFFVNTLALRVDLSRAPTVAELLGRVKARAVEAQHHTDIPFEQVVELMRPVRSLAHSPLFQVMFAWQNTPSGRLELPGLTFGALGAPPHLSAKYDLTLNLQEAGGRIVGVVEYATALFERTTVERQVRYLRRALEAMVADDAQAVQRIALLTPAERQHLVEAHNDTTTEYPADTCVHELFEAQAARTPDAVALVHDADELTFAELNARANRLAHHLRELGVGPDARVAIGVDHGVEMVVGLLAVLKAGGAYLPLDPAYPEARLRFMLEDAAPVLLLTQSSLADRFAGMGTPLLALDGDADAWAEMAETNPPRAGLTRDHLAYVIFTSGSTGTPKGALVPHGGLTHYAWWARTRYAAGAPLSFALYSSFAFDLTVTSIFVPLITGGAIVVYGEGEGADLPILRVFAEDRVDAVKLTPAHLALLDGSTQAGGRIRTLVVGGEDLGTGLARSRQDGSAAELVIYNEYGPTETVVGCAIHRFDPRRDLAASVPIGRPIANTRVYVLDAHGEPVPPGVVGELFVGGAQVTRGYLNRPALTAERFVPNPFGEGRLYRTGDRVRRRADGVLEFIGRDDDQVKVRGFRIELGEVEAALASIPSVREVAVVARGEGSDRRLFAYVTPSGEAPAPGDLRNHLRARLPDYMIPA